MNFLKNLSAKKNFHAITLAVITLVYAVVAFWGLGNIHAPQTNVNIKSSEDIVIDLGSIQKISRINSFMGIGTGKLAYYASKTGDSWYKITMSYEANGAMKPIASQELAHTSAFTWQVLRVDEEAQYIKIIPNPDDGRNGMYINEVAIYGGETLLPIVSVTLGGVTATELYDEQDYAEYAANYMNGTYFDEIYHPRTAYEILHQLPVYETTHPPLGKLFIATGISIFGMTPFGWRFMGTLFGVLMLPILYLLAKKLFKDKNLALFATTLFSLDFMHFSLTRMATIDSYPVFFILLSLYFLLCYLEQARTTLKETGRLPNKNVLKPLIFSGISFGLGCASKWITFYSAFAILAIILVTWYKMFIERKRNASFVPRHFMACALCYIAIPALIYFSAYIPQLSYDLQGRTISKYFMQNQEYMLNYHSTLTATHPYSSSALSWLVDGKPLWAYSDPEAGANGEAGTINIMGNPFIWWLGSLAIIAVIIEFARRKKFVPMFISLGFLAQYVPWLLVDRELWKDSGRILFIYHFFACVPFIILAICYVLREAPKWTWLLISAAAFALCIWFYPALTGVVESKSYFAPLVWMKNWVIYAR